MVALRAPAFSAEGARWITGGSTYTIWHVLHEEGLSWQKDRIPQPGRHWSPEGEPVRYPHEYIHGGTAKLLTLFHPATGEVRVKGAENAGNAVLLHPWLKEQLSEILTELPPRWIVHPKKSRAVEVLARRTHGSLHALA